MKIPAAVLLAVVLLAGPAVFADSIGINDTSHNNFTVTEGDFLVQNYTAVVIVDSSSSPLILSAPSFSEGPPPPGAIPGNDFTDILTSITVQSNTCVASGGGPPRVFAPGTTSTCTFQLVFGTPSDPRPEADTDSGHWDVISTVSSLTPCCVQSNDFIGGSGRLFTIVDAPASATPEPSSLMMLGTGLLGLVGAWWRKRVG